MLFTLKGAASLLVLYVVVYGTQVKCREVETVIVTGARTAIDALDFGTQATVISELEIQKNQYRTLGDALSSVPGLYVASLGGRGAQTSVFIRGSESNHILVLVDGVPVSDPSSAVPFSFAALSLLGVQRIEVLRGVYGAQFGSEAIGGVIQIFTNKGSAVGKRNLRLESGNHGTVGASFSVSAENYFLGVEHFQTQGESFTPQALRGGQEGEKDGHERLSLKWHFDAWLGDDWQASGNIGYLRSATEFDDYLGESDVQKELREQRLGHLVLSRSFFSGVLDMQWSLQYFDSHRRYPFSLYHNTYRGNVYNVRFNGIYRVRKDLQIQFGGEHERTDVDVDGGVDASLRAQAFFGQILYELTPSWFATLALRNDVFEKIQAHQTYRISLSHKVATHDLAFFGNYGTGFRAADLNEQFGVGGNPELRPEQSRAWEIGIEKKFPKWGFDTGVSYFQNRLAHLIEWEGDFLSGGLRNLEHAEITGGEMFFQYRSDGQWNMRFDQSLTSAKRGDGSYLLRRPLRKSSLKLDWNFMTGEALLFALDYIGMQWDIGRTDALAKQRGGYLLARLVLTKRFHEKLMAFVRIDNLFDRDYEPVSDYQGQGFEVLAGFTARW